VDPEGDWGVVPPLAALGSVRRTSEAVLREIARRLGVDLGAEPPGPADESEDATVRLPTSARLTAGRQRKLRDLLNHCRHAKDRSQADWNLYCWALEEGIDKEVIWVHGKDIGKPGVRGREYFDLSWRNAKKHVQEQIKERIRQEAGAGNAAGSAEQDVNLTDLGNARKLVAAHGGDFRHCFPWHKDPIYDARHWAEDRTGQIERFAKSTIRRMYADAANLADATKRAALVKHALDSKDAKRVRNTIQLARSEPGIPVLPGELDKDPMLLNCPNGTLDLRTGQLRKHRREDYLTRLCPTEYHPGASAPSWESFLDAVFQKDLELIVFVQRLLGRCLTGDISEQIVPIFWGSGANGKSTLIGAVMETLGRDYCMKASVDLLMARRGERHPTELVDLFGMRLVLASETNQGRMLNEALIKDLTGGEPIRARRMREDFCEISPTHKLILQTNHKPIVLGTDEGIWRRLRLVPLEVRCWDPADPANGGRCLPQSLKQDKTLPNKLRMEKCAILAWLVRGCQDWLRAGSSRRAAFGSSRKRRSSSASAAAPMRETPWCWRTG
jgi:P4 family phage/plasmid primase-like protien